MNKCSYIQALGKTMIEATQVSCGEVLPETTLDEDIAFRLAELFKVLGDPNRVRIVSLLLDHELCVHDLTQALDMSQSAVSHQLRTLRQLQLVKHRKDGRHVYYTLDDDHVRTMFEQGLLHVEHG